jgi:uncharacterized protein (DUF952 family)
MLDTTPIDWLVHLCTQSAWNEALLTGEYRPASLAMEGFIHCSRPRQMIKVANLFYQGIPDLVLLWLDPQRVSAEIRWEAVGDQVFPHIYGPLITSAIQAVRPFIPDLDGTFRQEPGL